MNQASSKTDLDELKSEMDRRFMFVDERFKAVDKRFDTLEDRFDDMMALVSNFANDVQTRFAQQDFVKVSTLQKHQTL